jgi:hypothetical protein
MNGLIKQTNLEGISLFGSLGIALFSIAALVHAFTTGMVA